MKSEKIMYRNSNTNAETHQAYNLSSRKLWELLSENSEKSLSRTEKQELAIELINRCHYLSEVYHWKQQQLEVLH